MEFENLVWNLVYDYVDKMDGDSGCDTYEEKYAVRDYVLERLNGEITEEKILELARKGRYYVLHGVEEE